MKSSMLASLVIAWIASPMSVGAQEVGPAELSFLGPRLGHVQALEVNGVSFEVATSHFSGSVAAFAASFRARCADPVEVGDDVSRYLGCSRTRSGLVALRMVWAHAGEEGTVLVEVVSHGASIAPRHGTDAPGGDLSGMPRPPASCRILSVRSEGGLSLVSYELAASESVLSAALRAIESAGWRPVLAAAERGVVRFRRGERTVDAIVTRDGEHVRVTFIEAPVVGEDVVGEDVAGEDAEDAHG